MLGGDVSPQALGADEALERLVDPRVGQHRPNACGELAHRAAWQFIAIHFDTRTVGSCPRLGSVSAPLVLAGNNIAGQYALDVAVNLLGADAVTVLAPPDTSTAGWQVSLARSARALGVVTLTPADVNAQEAVSAVAEAAPGLVLSVYYTQIFKAPFFAAIDCPAINFHPSLLPRHRGTAPLIWAIADGETRTGVTAHHIDTGIDTGDVVDQQALPIHRDDTGFSLHRKAALLVRAMTASLLRQWARDGSLPPRRQQHGEASYHSRKDPPLNHVDWSAPSERVRNVVRALAHPLPGAHAWLDRRRIVLDRVEPVPAAGRGQRPPGMVTLLDGGEPAVWAADGPVRLATFIDDGRAAPAQGLVEAGVLYEGAVLE